MFIEILKHTLIGFGAVLAVIIPLVATSLWIEKYSEDTVE